MSEAGIPVRIGAPSPQQPESLSTPLAEAAADVIRLHVSVIDREDRLESGTGGWRAGFVVDEGAVEEAVQAAVLRALRMATDGVNFEILEKLSGAAGMPIDDLAAATGLGRVPLAERVGDLISAGMAIKIPEANQVARSSAGSAIVDLVHRSTGLGAADLLGGGS